MSWFSTIFFGFAGQFLATGLVVVLAVQCSWCEQCPPRLSAAHLNELVARGRQLSRRQHRHLELLDAAEERPTTTALVAFQQRWRSNRSPDAYDAPAYGYET